MKNFRVLTTPFLTLLILALLSLTQSCNVSSIDSTVFNSGLRAGSDDETVISYVQKHKGFGNIIQLSTDHSNLLRSKPTKLKKLGKKELDDFTSKLSVAKTSDEVQEAFSIISNEPAATVKFLDATYLEMAGLNNDLIKQGIDKETSARCIAAAFKRDYQNKINNRETAR